METYHLVFHVDSVLAIERLKAGDEVNEKSKWMPSTIFIYR